MNYETATIFRGRKFLWQKSIKKKPQNILCVTWYLCRGKKEGKKEAAYLKPADVAAPLGLFQLSDLHSILRQLLRIWKQPDHFYFWCFKRKWLHGEVSTYNLLDMTILVFYHQHLHHRRHHRGDELIIYLKREDVLLRWWWCWWWQASSLSDISKFEKRGVILERMCSH